MLIMKEAQHQSEGPGRWGNGAVADSPVREARIKALMLKEQATRELATTALPILSITLEFKSLHTSFDSCPNSRMSRGLSKMDTSPPSLPIRSTALLTSAERQKRLHKNKKSNNKSLASHLSFGAQASSPLTLFLSELHLVNVEIISDNAACSGSSLPTKDSDSESDFRWDIGAAAPYGIA
jgi:hypothetical protein